MSKSAAKKQPPAEPVKSVLVRTEPVAREPVVTIDSGVTRRIRQHARAHFKTEVCGVLIGESTDEAIEIRASIEALNAAQAGTHVTFTQDAWEEIYKVKDEHYPDARIVGWYHSHPGFGIFLSEHDLFIQENFFSSAGQVAWVYDPHSDDEGCFGWVAGKVARLTSVSITYQSEEPVEHSASNQGLTPPVEEEDADAPEAGARSPRQTAAWVRWSQTALTHVMVLVAGFALAYFLFPRTLAVIPNPLTGEVDVINYRDLRPYIEKNAALLRALEQQNHSLPPAPQPTSPPSAAASPAPSASPSATPAGSKAPAPAPAKPTSQGSHK